MGYASVVYSFLLSAFCFLVSASVFYPRRKMLAPRNGQASGEGGAMIDMGQGWSKVMREQECFTGVQGMDGKNKRKRERE